MAKCPKCGADIGEGHSCQACDAPQGKGVFERGVNKTARMTGKVIEKGMDVTEEVVREAKPVFKKAIDLGKRGVTKAKDKTREVAKDLQEKD